MEKEGKQSTSRDRMMKMQIEAAAAAAADEKDDDVKKKTAVVGSGGGSGGGTGSSGSKRSSSGGSSVSAAARSCQAEHCAADLTAASKQYYRRHRVCEYHAKAAAVLVGGVRQRFCQQCSRFHELLEFDDTKRSCRRRLAGHNERRRKNSSSESNSDGWDGKVSRLACEEVEDRGKIHLTIPLDSANRKHYNIS